MGIIVCDFTGTWGGILIVAFLCDGWALIRAWVVIRANMVLTVNILVTVGSALIISVLGNGWL